MSLQIRRLSYHLGAEIIGLDIGKSIEDGSFSEIHAAFLDYGVLLFRGSAITREEHVRFSRLFGEVDINDEGYSTTKRLPEYPEILVNRPEPNALIEKVEGQYWHTDKVHSCNPPMATLLHAVEVPDAGGDTMFSNMYIAYEALSDRMKRLIEGLYGIHSGGSRAYKRSDPPVAQPIVRVHPETGRRSLYLTEKVKQFVGLTIEESKPLLEFLCQHAARPQFVYRHRWEKNDLLVWDNRCMNHYALGDYDRKQIRHMERTTVLGTPSGGYMYEGGGQTAH